MLRIIVIVNRNFVAHTRNVRSHSQRNRFHFGNVDFPWESHCESRTDSPTALADRRRKFSVRFVVLHAHARRLVTRGFASDFHVVADKILVERIVERGVFAVFRLKPEHGERFIGFRISFFVAERGHESVTLRFGQRNLRFVGYGFRSVHVYSVSARVFNRVPSENSVFDFYVLCGGKFFCDGNAVEIQIHSCKRFIASRKTELNLLYVGRGIILIVVFVAVHSQSDSPVAIERVSSPFTRYKRRFFLGSGG